MNSWSDYSHKFSEKFIIAGFTNRHYLYSSENDRVEFAKILKLDYRNIVIPEQIHSNKVVCCTKAGNIIGTDGIVTNKKDLILSIQIADCIPIYLFDKQNYNIGLIHAGWRGVIAGIIENSIERMKELDSKQINIEVLLGPSIRKCCFEVGPEVGKLFDSKYQIISKGDRTHLDLQNTVIEKLINMDIQSENIIDINECTCCSNKYHSYRRDGSKAGRMIAMMGRQTSQ